MRAAGSRCGKEGSLSTGGAHPLRLPEGERAWTSIKAVLTVGDTSECDRLHRLFAITLMGSGSRAVVPLLVPSLSTPGAGTYSERTDSVHRRRRPECWAGRRRRAGECDTSAGLGRMTHRRGAVGRATET